MARVLSDEDVEAIALKTLDLVEERIYKNVGKGVMRVFWGVVLTALIAVAALGHINFGGK